MPFVRVYVHLVLLFGRLALEIYALLYLSTILPYNTSLIHSSFIPLYTYGSEFLKYVHSRKVEHSLVPMEPSSVLISWFHVLC